MSNKSRVLLRDVKPITFQSHMATDDGEAVVYAIEGKGGAAAHIKIEWQHIGTASEVLARGAEEAATVRKNLGKSDFVDGTTSLQPQLVSSFQVVEYPDQNLKVLSLHSVSGFRCDFAIPTNTVDQLGRALDKAIAEELVAEPLEKSQKPN